MVIEHNVDDISPTGPDLEIVNASGVPFKKLNLKVIYGDGEEDDDTTDDSGKISIEDDISGNMKVSVGGSGADSGSDDSSDDDQSDDSSNDDSSSSDQDSSSSDDSSSDDSN